MPVGAKRERIVEQPLQQTFDVTGAVDLGDISRELKQIELDWKTKYQNKRDDQTEKMNDDVGSKTEHHVQEEVLKQKSAISLLLPGSCWPKSLDGKPSTTNPLPLYLAYMASSPSYWLVKPQ